MFPKGMSETSWLNFDAVRFQSTIHGQAIGDGPAD